MIFYIIAIVCGVLFLLLFTLFVIKGNKLKVLNLKVNEAENEVSDILKEKYSLLQNINTVLKSKGKEDLLKELEIIDVDKINSIELNKNLAKFDKTITELAEYNKEIVFDEEEEKLFDNLLKVNNSRLAVEKYYNDNALKLNELIDKFPSNIISKFKKYDERELFSNEKEEIFEILKK